MTPEELGEVSFHQFFQVVIVPLVVKAGVVNPSPVVHIDNSVNHVDNSVTHVDNSVTHVDNSVTHVDNSVHNNYHLTLDFGSENLRLTLEELSGKKVF